MDNLTQIRTFYINFEKTSNILLEYFNVETIFVDYKVDWRMNDQGSYEIFNTEIISIKKLNENNELEECDFNGFPDNINITMNDAMKSLTYNLNPHDPNIPKICKKYSSML